MRAKSTNTELRFWLSVETQLSRDKTCAYILIQSCGNDVHKVEKSKENNGIYLLILLAIL